MNVLAIIVGIFLVVSVLADVVHTLVTTGSHGGRWWLTRVLYQVSWSLISRCGKSCRQDRNRERLYAVYAPISVLAMLATWVTQQVVGFGLIWWGLRAGIEGNASLLDSLYFSGVVYFTVGFGEVVPVDQVPRFGALIEAFAGVLTIALVIGYLPALYSAYSEREQKLLTLDDGSEQRITPTNLVLARSRNADPASLDDFFGEWEAWIAHVLETHTTFPMLRLFRSEHPGQNWITALGLIADASLHVELTEEGRSGPAYWTLRRAAALLSMLAQGADLTQYRERLDASYAQGEAYRTIYDAMVDHGFAMSPFEEAQARGLELRRTFDAQLEYLIDQFDAPRGFWGYKIGHRLDIPGAVPVETTDSVFE